MANFISKDGRFGCRLGSTCLRRLELERQAAWPRETGGILLGFYNASLDLATITMVEPAPPDSRSGKFSFARGIHGLALTISRAWSSKTIRKRYYLGEWHTHPDGPPVPSPQDIYQMKAVAQDPGYHCPEPLLIILGGSRSRLTPGVFVFPGALEMVELYKAGAT
ncbi:MAG: Mov34/MPN/PAD-1 family protein [Acidobacteria bacterium]|nr:Mov34/MPN/PAD-1 family protein [Acidobacteriota bacterium]